MSHLPESPATDAARQSVPVPADGHPGRRSPATSVVRNHVGQYSVWPTEHKLPGGWQKVGPQGTESDCLAWIRDEWTDLRPHPTHRRAAPQSAWRLIAAHAESSGDRVAIDFDGVETTYRELMAQATRAAAVMSPLLDREGLVGVLLPNSTAAVVAMLAAMMTGGAYVPLDSHFPRERLSAIVADAGIDLIVTDERGADEHRGLAPQVLDIGAIISADSCGWAPPSDAGDPDTLACVYYTSGSTGTPRGVMMSHGALSAYVANLVTDWSIGPGDRFLQFSSLIWATSGEEIFTCLSGGSTLVIDTASRSGTAWEFLAMAADRQLTIADLPTVFWRELAYGLADGIGMLPPSLRLVVIGGDNLDRASAELWRAHTSEAVRLVNTYGSTEFGLALQAEVGAKATEAGLTAIGRPLPGVAAYVDGMPIDALPAGTTGELAIGGHTVARGYLGDSALTAERFRPDPQGPAEGGRCFRTRDLVEVGADGELLFVGRADRQVKVRGSRVDLTEIEAALEGASSVLRAVAVPITSADGQTELFALVSGVPGAAVDAGELRKHVAHLLPTYARPNKIFVVESLRLLPSGKKDLQGARQQVIALRGVSLKQGD
ncbi:amino acid adenylation domain-containing protein [Micromonospora sp. DT233]|uniref:amino acid adenylation domain-containing protein n=1 Tax=Micromonospora sp. DT233 TaxID=3393432 RepID=UPI003CFAF8F0